MKAAGGVLLLLSHMSDNWRFWKHSGCWFPVRPFGLGRRFCFSVCRKSPHSWAEKLLFDVQSSLFQTSSGMQGQGFDVHGGRARRPGPGQMVRGGTGLVYKFPEEPPQLEVCT